MNFASIVLLAVIALLIVAAMRYLVKNGGSCGKSCGCCEHCTHCGREKEKKN